MSNKTIKNKNSPPRFDFDSIVKNIKLLFASKYFYISFFVLLLGYVLNILAQVYLHNYVSDGNRLPVIYDLLFRFLPYYDVSYLYDNFAIFSCIVFLFYVFYKNKLKELPFYLLVVGSFLIVRSLFVVLTPLGNPAEFIGTSGIFKAFSRYELGLYPSGHTGAVFLTFLFSKGIFKIILGISCLIVVLALFLSRSHYSIDILSGIIFAYAIYHFGKDHFNSFVLK